ncbi:MAG: hypothetical protein IT429_04265 [Gemmataceae bacterium]|nr:hypothetical protein [Gemmataceae bacterium]
MPESPPPWGRTAAPERTAASARDASLAAETPQVQVRYYRRMRPHRVYPFVVSWKGRGRGSHPVILRLVVGGAQVVPFEQTLDPGDANARAIFFVTPLVKGHLRGERLEVVQQGRKVQEVRLPCRATTQRKTWFLLALTVAVAWWVVPLFNPAFDPRTMDPGTSKPAEAVASRISQYLPPTLPIFDKPNNPVKEELEAIPEHIGHTYTYLYFEPPMYYLDLGVIEYQLNAGEIILVAFGTLTLLSWWCHRERRKRRVSAPIVA